MLYMMIVYDCDEVLDSIEDLWPPLRQGIHEQDETKKVNVIYDDSV